VVPRYGSVGASGDLMPSAYIARVLVAGEAEFQGRRLPAAEALEVGRSAAHAVRAQGSARADQRHHRDDRGAALVWVDACSSVLRALLGAVALAIEALQAPSLPFEPWVHESSKAIPDRSPWPRTCANCWNGSDTPGRIEARQTCYSLRCVPQGLGPAWEALEDGRAPVEREINSANDNPLIDPERAACTRPAISTAATSRACWTPGKSTSPPWRIGATR
jgi:histidine ammonia-lyase